MDKVKNLKKKLFLVLWSTKHIWYSSIFQLICWFEGSEPMSGRFLCCIWNLKSVPTLIKCSQLYQIASNPIRNDSDLSLIALFKNVSSPTGLHSYLHILWNVLDPLMRETHILTRQWSCQADIVSNVSIQILHIEKMISNIHGGINQLLINQRLINQCLINQR